MLIYIMIGLSVILLLALIIEYVKYYRNGKIVLESKSSVLEPDVEYHITFRPNTYFRKTWSIIPKKEHNTVLVENTYYNNRVDMNINVYASGVIVYSVYLKNVLTVEDLKDN